MELAITAACVPAAVVIYRAGVRPLLRVLGII
jgi:hypothetical protein